MPAGTLSQISAGVIVMIGLGGRRHAEGHERDTIATLVAMGLGEGDLLYFSDLVETPATSYTLLAADADLGTLTREERRAQQARIRTGLARAGIRPQFAAYDIREFTY